MKKVYTSPALCVIAYEPQPTIAATSTVDGEIDLMDDNSPTVGI